MSKSWDDLTEKEKQRMGEIWKRETELKEMTEKIDTELEKLRNEKQRIRKVKTK